jgi:hypothetical protein
MPEETESNFSSVSIRRVQGGEGSLPSSLAHLGDNYLQLFISFREIIQLNDSLTGESRSPFEFKQEAALLNPDEKKELDRFLTLFAKQMAFALGAELPEALQKEQEADEFRVGEEVEYSFKSPEVQAIVSAFFSRNVHHALAPDKRTLIAQSLLTAVVSSFEVLVGSVARHAFKVNKTALEKSEHEFTLEELSEYDSIEEARNELISRRVESLLLGSVDDWSNWCKRVLQFDLKSLTSDWPAVREVFARRNIIVHNAGAVNNRYLKIARDANIGLPDNVKAGDTIVTDTENVSVALQQILALGLCLVYSVWRKLDPKSAGAAADWLVNRQGAIILHEELWITVNELSICLKGANIKRRSECLTKVYGWLARQKMYGTETTIEEISDWDISGLEVEFLIYKECLLGNTEATSNLIKQHPGVITNYEIAVNPIFSELKSHLAQKKSADVRDENEGSEGPTQVS